MTSYEPKRLPERRFLSAAELRAKLNGGEEYRTYIKTAGELLSSLWHALTQQQRGEDNAEECAALCGLIESTVSHLDHRDGQASSILRGLHEQKERYIRLFDASAEE